MSPDVLPQEETEAALKEILAAPPFGQTDVTRDLAQRLIDWYQGTIGELQLSNPVLFWGLVVALSLVLALLLWHITISVRAVWRAVRGEQISDAAGEDRGDRRDLGPARAALASGEYRRAVELAWAIATASLLSAGEEARTPRQQARVLDTRLPPRLRPHLLELLRLHEDACYAGEATAAPQAEAAVARAGSLTGAEPDG